MPLIKPNKTCPSPVGVIDAGTNTIRLLIGCVIDGKVIRIASDRAVTRLGNNLKKTGTLDPENSEKSITSINKFKEECETYNASKIVAVGTSALREAQNSDEFLSEVKRRSGIDIQIISGEKEAELTLKGISGSFEETGRLSYPAFIIDVGGGSAEWIFQRSRSVFNADSIPIGAVKLHEAFIKHDPPMPEELRDMQNYISKAFLDSLDSSLVAHRSSLSFIATGGTAATIASIALRMDKYDGDKVHMRRIALSSLKKIYESLIKLPIKERAEIKGLEPERADIVVPGILILLVVMEIINAGVLTVSDYGLLEGLLLDYC
jgi:exopolyphosphatase/guanosine-5'-triphosphate,3'-diphosphate pyrophosphatase